MGMFIFLILIVGAAFLAIFLTLNGKAVSVEREGIVKEVLNKDAFVVQFEDAGPTIVRFHGISMASESEMMDDKIFDFLQTEVRGGRVLVKPKRVSTGDVIIGELHSMRGEYFNATMVRRGFARWSPSEAADDRELAEAQKEAKLEQLGVWNPAVRQLLVGRMRDQESEASQATGEASGQGDESSSMFASDGLANADLNPENR
jgi:hypothetical protein